MTDIVERINDIWANDDHERGCQGREYSCSCGFDNRTAKTAEDAATEITRLRNLLSEAEKREREARVKALGDAAEAIFVMGAWSPNYEKLVPNTFDEGTSAAYEIVCELQGKAEIPLTSEER